MVMEQMLHKMEYGFNKIEDSQSVSPESTRNYTKQRKTETDQEKEKPKPPAVETRLRVRGLCVVCDSVHHLDFSQVLKCRHSSYSS